MLCSIWELEHLGAGTFFFAYSVQQFGLAIFQFAWYLQTIVGFWLLVGVCQLWVVGPVAYCLLLLGPTPRGRLLVFHITAACSLFEHFTCCHC